MKKTLTLLVAMIATCALWASNVITYTASKKLTETTGSSYSGLHTDAFDVAITSHTFADSTGTITFSGEVTSIGDKAFYNCSGLTSVAIPNSVTSIGDYAFDGCSGLTAVHISDIAAWCRITFVNYTSNPFYYANHLYVNGSEVTDLVIPNSVTSIGSYTVDGCSGLTSVTIPNSVTSIGTSAFYGCSGLTSVTISNSVTSIGTNAFYGCSGLTAVHISDIAAWCRITFVNYTSNPFYYANHLYVNGSEVTDLVIPNSVTSIGSYTFDGCSSLTSITIPNSVTSIGTSAFYGCSGLTSVAIPNSVTSIGERAFLGCSSLTSVTIPSSVTSIGDYAFSGCSGLTSVTIPNSVTSIGTSAFNGCSSLTAVHISDIAAWCRITFVNHTSNPFFYANHLYVNGSEVTDLVIPNSVTSIGTGAFSGCSSLTSITIPNSVTSIGGSAFEGCSGLTSITCEAATPPTCESSNWLFYGVSTSIPVYVPCDAVSAYQAAEGWSRFTNIQPIEGTCTAGQCGDSLYWSIENDTLFITGTGAMYDYNYPDNRAPWQALAITSVSLPEGITSIGDYAFLSCSDLTSVTIPNSVTHIGNSAFLGCTDLTSVSIPNSVTSLGEYAFGYCTSLTSIIIPNSVTSISPLAFSGCSGLTSVTLPNSLTSIGDGTFAGCQALTSISIPGGVTSIGAYAFTACFGLTSITCEATTPPSCGTDCFASAPTTIPVYVPCTSVAAYQTAEGWSVFNNIQPIEGTCPPAGQCGDSLYWSIENDTLFITGTGAMFDYNDTNNKAPWRGVTFTSVLLPEGMTSIGEEAFYRCSGLTSVTIPNSVTSIGGSAFKGCSGLTSITIPESVEHVHPYAFYWCSSLTSVVWNARNIASSDLVINNQVYPIFDIGNPTITSFVFGENVLVIPPYLCGYQPIQTITIPASVNTIHYYAFADCSSLTSITCEATSIPYGAYGCFKGISSSIPVYVPCALAGIYPEVSPWNTFTNIQSIAGSSCERRCGDNLYWDYADSTLTITGTGAMYDYNYPDNRAPWQALAITSVSLPEGITSIGDYAFLSCSDLTSVTIPNSVTSIGYGAFGYCTSMTSITIPESVTTIGESAFEGCSGLTSITCEAATPPTCESSNWLFYGVSTSIPVYVPCDAVSAYQAAEGWSRFTNIQPIEGSCTTTYTISLLVNNAEMGTVIGAGEYNAGNTVTISAISSTGYQFNGWNDGNTDNPRTFVVNSDTTFTAFFGTKMCTLTLISNNEEVSELTGAGTYAYGSLVTCTADAISDYHFVKWSNGKTSNPYKFKIYEDMTLYAFFEEDDAPVTTTEVVVTPTDSTAGFLWPQVDEANSYTLTITKDGETICTLTFDGIGRLINIDFAPAPGRSTTTNMTSIGFNFTITGLTAGTTYVYTIEAKNSKGEVISTEEGIFTTTGIYTDIESVSSINQVIKVLRDGQLFILCDGKSYNAQGMRVE